MKDQLNSENAEALHQTNPLLPEEAGSDRSSLLSGTLPPDLLGGHIQSVLGEALAGLADGSASEAARRVLALAVGLMKRTRMFNKCWVHGDRNGITNLERRGVDESSVVGSIPTSEARSIGE